MVRSFAAAALAALAASATVRGAPVEKRQAVSADNINIVILQYALTLVRPATSPLSTSSHNSVTGTPRGHLLQGGHQQVLGPRLRRRRLPPVGPQARL